MTVEDQDHAVHPSFVGETAGNEDVLLELGRRAQGNDARAIDVLDGPQYALLDADSRNPEDSHRPAG